jgi:hypothetical protein
MHKRKMTPKDKYNLIEPLHFISRPNQNYYVRAILRACHYMGCMVTVAVIYS